MTPASATCSATGTSSRRPIRPPGAGSRRGIRRDRRVAQRRPPRRWPLSRLVPDGRDRRVTATATSDGFRDDGAHRQAHAPIYRSYTRTDLDPLHDDRPDGEDRHALLRVLLLTGFLADEFLADFDAEQVIVLSASSKTAIGFSQRAAKRDGLAVVGLTSAANADFVRSLGFYDTVVTYDEIDDPDTGISVIDSVVIDMAGNPNVLAAVHQRLGDRIKHSMMIGRSHHDAVPTVAAGPLPGPAPQFFFAPTELDRLVEAWGAARVPPPDHRGDPRVHRRQPRLDVDRRAPRPRRTGLGLGVCLRRRGDA